MTEDSRKQKRRFNYDLELVRIISRKLINHNHGVWLVDSEQARDQVDRFYKAFKETVEETRK